MLIWNPPIFDPIEFTNGAGHHRCGKVLTRLSEYRAAGNAELFDYLKEFLSDGWPVTAEVAAELGMTENAVKQAFIDCANVTGSCATRSPRLSRCPETSKTSCAISFRCFRRNLWENFDHTKQRAAY